MASLAVQNACFFFAKHSLWQCFIPGAYRAGKGACNCVLRNVASEIQTWLPMLFLVSLHIAMYGNL